MKPASSDDPLSSDKTPIEAFEVWATRSANKTALVVEATSGDVQDEFDYATLSARVSCLAAQLEGWGARGDRVLLPFENTAGFVIAYLACLRAGVVSVPAPLRGEPERLRGIIADCHPSLVLCDADSLPHLSRDSCGTFQGVVVRSIEGSTGQAAAPTGAYPAPDEIATLQYTSGTTSDPKGVCVSHANIMHNARHIRTGFEIDENAVIVSWLPLFHDMGLFGGMLQPLLSGGRTILLPRSTALRNPLLWLESISRHRATHSGAPDFAFEACVRALERRRTLKDIDLSEWRVAWNGAETVRPRTLARFSSAFARHGFRADAFLACYGMAEATLLVSGTPVQSLGHVRRFLQMPGNRMVPAAPDTPGGRVLVSNGYAAGYTQLQIAPPDSSEPLPEGHIGEICIAGPQCPSRYWSHDLPRVRLPDSEGMARNFLRSGDLGFLSDRQLFVTGRKKDVIIRHGRNLSLHDIEDQAALASSEVQTGNVVAFEAPAGRDDTVSSIILAVGMRKRSDAPEIVQAVQTRIFKTLGVVIDHVVLIPRSEIARTSSGKIRRHEMLQRYQSGVLSVLNSDTAQSRGSCTDKGPESSADLMLLDMLAELRRALPDGPPKDFDLDLGRPLYAQGFDSLSMLQLSGMIEECTGTVPSDELLADAPLAEISAWIAERMPDAPAIAANAPRDASSSLPAKLPMTREQAALCFADEGKWRAVTLLALALPAGQQDDRARLETVLDRLLARHPQLCARVELHRAAPVFVAAAEPCNAADLIEWLDVSPSSNPGDAGRGDDSRERALWLCARAPLDLTAGPGLRLVVAPERGGSLAVVLAVHHLLCDGRSLDILGRDIVALWTGREPEPVFCAPFALLEAEESGVSGAAYHDAMTRRLAALKTVPPEVDPPWPRPPDQTGAVPVLPALRFDLSRTQSDAAMRLAARMNVGSPAVHLVAWRLALQQLGLPGTAAINVMQALRDSTRSDIGPSYAVRPVPLAPQASDGTGVGVGAMVRAAQDALTDARASEAATYPLVIEALGAVRGTGYAPFMQIQFGFHRSSLPMQNELRQACRAAEETGTPQGFWLPQMEHVAQANLQILQAGVRVSAMLCYDPATLRRVTAESLRDAFLAALDAMTGAMPEDAKPRLRLPDPACRAGPDPVQPADFVPINTLARRKAMQRPDAIAVLGADRSVTSGDLWTMIDRIGAALAGRRGVVAVLLPRSAELFAAQLAVLQAGCTCLPIDVEAPEGRVAEVLEDCAPLAILTNAAGSARLPGTMPVIDIETLPSDHPMVWPATISADDAAYLIYTSGSTGKPKGVLFPHQALLIRIDALCERMQIGMDDRLLHYVSPGFDPAVQEILTAAHTGATLVVAPQTGAFDPVAIAQIMARHGVTHMVALPSMLRAIAEQAAFAECKALRAIVCGGETLTSGLRDMVTRGSGVRLFNVYGATETTICATIWDATEEPAGRVGLGGTPLPATTVAIVDADGQTLPTGVIGEIAIGGMTLSAGYLNRPDQNARQFRALPRLDGRPASAYLTGDAGWMDRDGFLWVTGRLDNQLKISGHRIEPEEIAQRLSSFPGISAAHVRGVASSEGPRLVAYLVADGATPPKIAALRGHLEKSLSTPLVPRDYLFLARLPMTANGKIDTAALPVPPETGEPRPQPSDDPIYATLRRLWCETLRLDDAEPHASFFDLGGHSLLAFQLVSRIESAFALRLPANTLYRAPTIAMLAEVLRATRLVLTAHDGARLTALRSGGTLTPLIMFSPGLAGDRSLAHAAQHLAQDRPVLMLSTGQDNGETDLRELARGHLLTLETAGIRGPVHIAGYSIAAFIALAMAQEAETGGTPVASLTLIDPPDLLMLRAGRPFFAALRAMPFVSRITRKSRAGAQLLALADDERMQRHLALAARHPLKSVDTFVAVGLTRTGRHRRAAFWGKIAANLVLTDLEGTHASIVAGSDASRTARWLETIIEQSDTYAAMNGTSAAPHQED